MERQCRECGSERIVPGVPLLEDAPTGSLLARIRGWVCGDCGYTRLHAEDPLQLYLTHKRRSEGAGTPAAPGSEEGGAPGEAANIQCPSCGSVMSAADTSCEVCGWSPAQGRR